MVCICWAVSWHSCSREEVPFCTDRRNHGRWCWTLPVGIGTQWRSYGFTFCVCSSLCGERAAILEDQTEGEPNAWLKRHCRTICHRLTNPPCLAPIPKKSECGSFCFLTL